MDHLRVGANQSIDRFSLFPGLNDMVWWEFNMNSVPLKDLKISTVSEWGWRKADFQCEPTAKVEPDLNKE